MKHIKEIIDECDLLDEKGQCQEAIKLLSKAIEKHTDPRLFEVRGDRYDNIGEYQLALDDYCEAIRKAPDNPRSWLARGQLLTFSLGRSREAISDFKKAISLCPDMVLPVQGLCFCYLFIGELGSAFQQAHRAIELDSSNGYSYFCLGKCFFASDDYASAAENFDIAVKLDPNSTTYWMALGRSYLKIRDYEKALESYENANRLESSAMANISIGRIFLETGNPEISVEYLTVAQKHSLTDSEKLLVDSYLKIANKKIRET